MKVHLPLPRSDSISNTSNNVALERLASAAETKNEVGKCMALAIDTKNGVAKEQLMIQVGIATEQLMMQLFLANPQSVASIAFFATKSREYSADVQLPTTFLLTLMTMSNWSQNLDNFQTHRSLLGVSLTLRQPPLRTTMRTTRMFTKTRTTTTKCTTKPTLTLASGWRRIRRLSST
jgi:hypothetical protein